LELFENIKYLFEGIHDANKELAKGIRDDWKEFKTGMKDDIKQYYPTIGEAIEKIDRAVQTTQNFIDANNPLNVVTREFKHEQTPKLADHLVVQRFGYLHHGIYVDRDTVIHFSDWYVKLDSLNNFKGESTLNIKDTPLTYSPEEAVSRAHSKLGDSSYNVFSNNCEHFVNWCRSGSKYSDSI
jgi:NC domain.